MPDDMFNPRQPVLVGAGQAVERPKERELAQALSPVAMMTQAARRAQADCGLTAKVLWPHLDSVICVRSISGSAGARRWPFGNYVNPAASVAKRLGAQPEKTFLGPTGGNTPQYLVNKTADAIAAGEMETVLLTGAECLHSLIAALKAGVELSWSDDDPAPPPPVEIGEERDGNTAIEKKLGLHYPINAYPLFETALMHEAGRTFAQQRRYIGDLMAPFSRIAEGHQQAWFPLAHSAQEIAEPAADNRYIGFPYTKYMNAIMQVNQAAAVLMMTAGKARELGVPESKWVYLHGGADVNDLWYLSERENFHSSPAIKLMGRKALTQAGWKIDEVDYFDLYSCFPSAVQIGRKELGIAEDDPRSLTVTGGLPYFGGAGNNYAMHSIATMMDMLRAKPGSKGVCTANGWFITKHAIGLYSTTPPDRPWERENPAAYQKEIESTPHPAIAEQPDGAAKVETYTIIHGRKGVERGLVMGRLTESGARFPARLPDDPALLAKMMEKDQIGMTGQVRCDKDGVPCFTPAGG